MIVNKNLMDKARFEKKQIGELSVKEFRTLMQECFAADRFKKLEYDELDKKQRLMVSNNWQAGNSNWQERLKNE